MYAMRRVKTFSKAIFGKRNEHKEEPAWADFVMLTDKLKEAERQGLFSFHFVIKDNDLGTAERSNMAKRKEMPGRGKAESKRTQGRF